MKLLLATLLVAGCDAPRFEPFDAGGDAPAAGLGVGAACDGDPTGCQEGLECAQMWFGGTRLACMRPCTDNAECLPGKCLIEIDTMRYCTIPCDPIMPFEGCPPGTLCELGEGAMMQWASGCADWTTGVAVQNAPCGPSAGGTGCAAGLGCYTVDGGTSWRCTAVCETTTHRGCPSGFSCNPAGLAEGISYGYCIPPGGVWPDPMM